MRQRGGLRLGRLLLEEGLGGGADGGNYSEHNKESIN